MARVLVVDDNEALRTVIRVALEAAGFEVLVAGDGEEALAVNRECRADLIITDIFMPEKDGLETIGFIHSECPDTKIIAMSAGVPAFDSDYLAMAKMLGAAETLGKPFPAATLVAMVREVLAAPAPSSC